MRTGVGLMPHLSHLERLSVRLKSCPQRKQDCKLLKMLDGFSVLALPPIEQKGARWMGHSFISRGPASPVGD
jgi:hypothetical protein